MDKAQENERDDLSDDSSFQDDVSVLTVLVIARSGYRPIARSSYWPVLLYSKGEPKLRW